MKPRYGYGCSYKTSCYGETTYTINGKNHDNGKTVCYSGYKEKDMLKMMGIFMQICREFEFDKVYIIDDQTGEIILRNGM